MAQKITPVDDVFQVRPHLTTYGCYPILALRSGKTLYWYLSLRKAKVFWNASDEIQHFVSTSGSEAWMTMSRIDKKTGLEVSYPVLCLQDTECKSARYYELRLGLWKCKLLLHWKDYLQAFVESEGTEIPEPPNVIFQSTISQNSDIPTSAP